MEEDSIPVLYVGEDYVRLSYKNTRLKFPNDVWEALHKYVKAYREGTVDDGTIIRALPKYDESDLDEFFR